MRYGRRTAILQVIPAESLPPFKQEMTAYGPGIPWNFVNESVRVSREAYERAKEVGSLTKKELELKTLQGKLQKEYARLGGLAYHVLGEEQRRMRLSLR